MENIERGSISIYGAREHNLKNIDLKIPRNSLSVITGLSGSGKSSLAFDTIYAEGQRRYMETFSAYARQFLGGFERPDVDKIDGLSPVIAIEQKTTNKNPRSTVGTTTEIYDFFRLLYARAATAYSYETGAKMVRYGDDKIIELIYNNFPNKRVLILSPIVKGRKGHYKELFNSLGKKGFISVRIDGEVKEIFPDMKVDRYKVHDIEVVVDKLVINENSAERIKNSLGVAMKHGGGVVMLIDIDDNVVKYYSRNLMCPDTGLSYKEPAPHSFSFNSPHGACTKCKGLGMINVADKDKIMPDMSLSVREGGILPLGKYKRTMFFLQLEAVLKIRGFDIDTPLIELAEEVISDILYGYLGVLKLENKELGVGGSSNYDGVIKYIMMQGENETSKKARKWAEQFISVSKCDKCNGQRLNKESLHFRLGDFNISELSDMELSDLYSWCENIENDLSDKDVLIASEILKEIRVRIKFLLDVGLKYLSLNRASSSLSGGELQRIRLATQIGSDLINVLYLLDEPSIGLHQKDNTLLIESLKKLRDTGNTVIVVEHDRDIMENADYIVDIGPYAGRKGGEVVACGTFKDIIKSGSITGDYLSGKRIIPIPPKRREGNGKVLRLEGCRGNNLKNISVDFPLGKFICVTGVSGSGKSSLINSTLYPILVSHLHKAVISPLEYDKIIGIENLDKVIVVNQQPIGKTPRSNPATYTGIFNDIRKLYESLPDSKMRGFSAGRFSFNVKGGRCEKCKGAGYMTIEMNFLPDVYALCDSCLGKRYNKETLEVLYKGKSIGDVLDMTINNAADFFENISFISSKLETLKSVGLGYIKLGQQSTTLSGGEAQRIKLAAELSKRDSGNTMYILDEPTTGLHFEDIRVLLDVMNMLVDKGNSLIVIEHNTDIIKSADYIIDIGPDGGKDGGEVLSFGTPEEVAVSNKGYTPKYIRKELGMPV